MRPRGTAVRMPGDFVPTPRVGERPVAYRAHASVKPVLFFAGVQSPPLRGVEAPRQDGLAA